MASPEEPMENMQQLLNLFSFYLDGHDRITNREELKKTLTAKKNLVQNSLYFSQVATEPFDADKVINYFTEVILPQLPR